MPIKNNSYLGLSSATKKLVMTICGVFCLLEILIYFPSISSFINGKFLTSSIVNNTLISLTNDNREANNEPALKENPLLSRAAQLKAEDMAKNGYFSHVSPSGLTPWVWLKNVGYEYSYAGENLAMNFSDSADVVSAWMKSPTHKRNIINGNYKEIGIGVAEGIYNGNRTTFVVQFFASPAGVKPTSEAEINELVNPNNKINSFLSSSLADAAKKIGVKVFGNIHKVFIYFIGVFAILAGLLLLLNMKKYEERKLALVCNAVVVGLFVFLFTFSLIASSQNHGAVAVGNENISTSN